MTSQEKQVAQVLDKLQQEFPEAGTRLQWNSVFELLVATILSAQTTDEQVNRITSRLRINPAGLCCPFPDELEPRIKGCDSIEIKPFIN